MKGHTGRGTRSGIRLKRNADLSMKSMGFVSLDSGSRQIVDENVWFGIPSSFLIASVLLARNDNDLVRWEVCQIVRPDTKANADLIINNESVSKDLLEKNSNILYRQ